MPGILYAIAVGIAVANTQCAQACYNDASGTTLFFMLLSSLTGVVAAVWLIRREGITGQTPGKKMLGIRLVREATGQPLGFGAAFLRRLCHALDGICCVGFLWPLWDDKRQTFADKVTGSVVVKTR